MIGLGRPDEIEKNTPGSCNLHAASKKQSKSKKTVIVNEIATTINGIAMRIDEMTVKINEIARKFDEVAIKINDIATNINDIVRKINEIAIQQMK